MSERLRISVIVPVYNAERFLHKCVESLLAQTYENIEIILVDDGSRDSSPAICDAFAVLDTRVVVLHQENSGVSAARNSGVAHASGAYIAFVDADDFAEAELLSHMFAVLTEFSADVAVSGVRYVDHNGVTLPPVPPHVRCAMEPAEALSAMFYQTLFFTSPWAKLVPVELAKRYPFPVGRRYEDMATAYLWLANAKRIAVDTVADYFYVQHAESFMGAAFSPARFAQLDVSDEVCAYIAAHVPEVLPAARARRFSAYCQVLLATPHGKGEYEAERARMHKTMRRDAPDVMHDRNCRKKDRVAATAFRLFGEQGMRLLWRAARRGKR